MTALPSRACSKHSEKSAPSPISIAQTAGPSCSVSYMLMVVDGGNSVEFIGKM